MSVESEWRSLVVPPFTSVTWSEEAILNNYPRLSQRYSQAFRRLELDSITAGLRDCALIVVAHEGMAAFQLELKTRSLAYYEIMRINENSGYASGFAGGGKPTSSFVAVGSEARARTLAAAYRLDNHALVAELLNYPRCCASFFHVVWQQEHLKDTIWPMAVNTTQRGFVDKYNLALTGRMYANVLFKSIGVRAIFHLPCSVDCEPSEQLGAKNLALLNKTNSPDLDRFSRSVLGAESEWRAHYGVSLVENKWIRLLTNTDFSRQAVSLTLKVEEQ